MLKESLKNLQNALKELADLNRALDEALIVAITDVRGIITFANDKFCEISKYSREELLGANHRIINSGYHSQAFFKGMWKTIARGEIWRGEIRNQAKDGSFYWMDTTIVPLLNEQGKPYQYVSFRINVTERKRAEEYIRQSDKIAAAGQLASGIAHEIRNPLAAMKWALLRMQSEPQETKAEEFDLILSELDRIDSIVGEFLRLSKPQDTQFEVKSLHSMVTMIVTLMRIQARRNHIQLELNIEPDLPRVLCDENQLKQVFINIIKNAMEAMLDGGTIRITVSRLNSKQVAIEFVDEGEGIPPEVLRKVGEPFMTTKDKGSGLGLMISHKIVKDHGGLLVIESQPSEGTTVRVVLPVFEPMEAE